MFRVTSVNSNTTGAEAVLLQSQENGDTLSVFFDEEGRFVRAIRLSDGADISEKAVMLGLEHIARNAIIDRIDYGGIARSFGNDDPDEIEQFNFEPVAAVQWQIIPDEETQRFFVTRIVEDIKNGLPDPAMEELLYRQLFAEHSIVSWQTVLQRLFPRRHIPEFSHLFLLPGSPDGDGELIFTGFEPYPDVVVPAARAPWPWLVLEAGLLATLDRPETAAQYAQAVALVGDVAGVAEGQASALLDRIRKGG